MDRQNISKVRTFLLFWHILYMMQTWAFPKILSLSDS